MFDLGLSFNKLLIIGVLAAFLLGPERLPQLASQLARLVRSLREMATGAKDRLKDDMGEEYNEVDWKKLDPRQYDPRRIIREALTDEMSDTPGASVSSASPGSAASSAMGAGASAGFTASAGSAGNPGASGMSAAGSVSSGSGAHGAAGSAAAGGYSSSGGYSSGPRISADATARLRAIMAGEPVLNAPFDPDAT
ncbi:Sec-independent protein translocase protein TatA [Mycetocola sp. BIGb0189]|uniref:hypothetical protein n=1 Tax=Mycetocola sp. BIGb0189 TaxID=2940604 RepID=UPI002169C397|nr:hypothetical protein [Mycetocola sp. BIGb0189]MCS4275524.1 Sec-independent protein translocase protein TatA [Mycetocola sp. BIGb0189]